MNKKKQIDNIDPTKLRAIMNEIDLIRKLKFELIEVEKQLNKIKKLGFSKREMKKIFKKWSKSLENKYE